MHAEATAATQARDARGHAGDGELVAYRLEEEGDRAQASQSARASTRHAAPDDLADAPRMLFGVTLDQIDALNTLVETIRAYADAVSAEGMADFAEGTLSRLGHSIFDRASEALAFLGEIQDQPLPDEPRVSPFSVREAPASYHVQRAAMDRDALPTLPVLTSLAPGLLRSPSAASLH
ncbi:hypothetical protein [Pseudoxanthomonas sp. UC19_8]|uniref:hypothetical protein n=1 Tax=Pseudoxanthomonas sp. UC19_8 TaxID=3350175 RepID=UPI0036D3A864